MVLLYLFPVGVLDLHQRGRRFQPQCLEVGLLGTTEIAGPIGAAMVAAVPVGLPALLPGVAPGGLLVFLARMVHPQAAGGVGHGAGEDNEAPGQGFHFGRGGLPEGFGERLVNQVTGGGLEVVRFELVVDGLALGGGEGLGLDFPDELPEMQLAPGALGGQDFGQLGVAHGFISVQPHADETLQLQVNLLPVGGEEHQPGLLHRLAIPAERAGGQDFQEFHVPQGRQGLVDGFGAVAVEIAIPLPKYFLGGQAGFQQEMEGDGGDFFVVVIADAVEPDFPVGAVEEFQDFPGEILAGREFRLDLRSGGLGGFGFLGHRISGVLGFHVTFRRRAKPVSRLQNGLQPVIEGFQVHHCFDRLHDPRHETLPAHRIVPDAQAFSQTSQDDLLMGHVARQAHRMNRHGIGLGAPCAGGQLGFLHLGRWGLGPDRFDLLRCLDGGARGGFGLHVVVQLDDLHVGKEPGRLGREAHHQHRADGEIGGDQPAQLPLPAHRLKLFDFLRPEPRRPDDRVRPGGNDRFGVGESGVGMGEINHHPGAGGGDRAGQVVAEIDLPHQVEIGVRADGFHQLAAHPSLGPIDQNGNPHATALQQSLGLADYCRSESISQVALMPPRAL